MCRDPAAVGPSDLEPRSIRGLTSGQPAYDPRVNARELRHVVYRHFVDTGSAPLRRDLAELVGDLDKVDHLLSELHDGHMLVLDDRADRRGEIRMALPFAAEPTNWRVITDAGTWWANCAWDSLAILAALRSDGHVESTWADTGEPVGLEVRGDQLAYTDGYISFPLPASRWWDDIVFT